MSESSEELKRIANAIEEILRLVKLARKQLKKDGSINLRRKNYEH